MAILDQRHRVVRDKGGAAGEGLLEVIRRKLLFRPANPPQRLLGAFRVEISDAKQMNTRGARNLRKIHRAEFAGADQADSYGIAGGDALLEEPIEVHNFCLARPANAMFGDMFFAAKWDAIILPPH